MAKRRMFSLDIVDSDVFLEMPISTQALYFHIGMRADDDGICANPNRIVRDCGANKDDLGILLAKRFILVDDEENVIIVKHWKMNNYIQKDRYNQSTYKEVLKKLYLDDKGSYTFAPTDKPCIQLVSKMYTQDSIGKDSIEKELDLIKLDKTTHGVREIINILLTCKYIDSDIGSYIELIENYLKTMDQVDLKVKVKYFVETVSSYEEVSIDVNDKPVYSWIFSNTQIVDRYNYLKTSLDNIIEKEQYPF